MLDAVNAMKWLSLPFAVRGAILSIEGDAVAASKYLSQSLDMYEAYLKHFTKSILATGGTFTNSASNLVFMYFLSALLGREECENTIAGIICHLVNEGSIQPMPEDTDFFSLVAHLTQQPTSQWQESVYAKLATSQNLDNYHECLNYRAKLANYVFNQETYSIFTSIPLWVFPIEIAVLLQKTECLEYPAVITESMDPVLSLNYDKAHEHAELVKRVISQF